MHILLATLLLLLLPSFSATANAQAGMHNQQLHHLIKRIDSQPKGELGRWEIQYKNRSVYIITDERANRMRIISPIASAETLDKDVLYRVMQANFDSALDARYALAQKILWSAFIHPLAELSAEQFYSGLAQTITLVESYGDSYSSGALVFNGGDSQQLHRKTYLDILRKGIGK